MKRHGRKLVSNARGTDGVCSQVKPMPEQKLGFVFLASVSEYKLLKGIRGIIWANTLDIR